MEDNFERKVKSIYSSAKQLVVQHFKSTSAHGLPHVFGEKAIPIKILWLLAFFGSLSFCLYYVILSFIQYFTYQTSINTQVYKEIPTEFPAVSICNLKSINITAFDEMGLSSQYNLPWSLNMLQHLDPHSFMFYQKYLASSMVNNISYSIEYKKNLGFQLEKMLISCVFNSNPCSYTDFYYFYHPW